MQNEPPQNSAHKSWHKINPLTTNVPIIENQMMGALVVKGLKELAYSSFKEEERQSLM